ncbi:WhiB family transcriptional regulator [Amycolatopsis sp. NPDC003861]
MHADPKRWHQLARCRLYPTLNWHSTASEEAAVCRRICDSCTVRAPCLAEALTERDPWGIWGGLTPDEREQVAGEEAVRILPTHGTNSRYAKHGCRCSRCRAAHTAYERSRRQRGRTPCAANGRS